MPSTIHVLDTHISAFSDRSTWTKPRLEKAAPLNASKVLPLSISILIHENVTLKQIKQFHFFTEFYTNRLSNVKLYRTHIHPWTLVIYTAASAVKATELRIIYADLTHPVRNQRFAREVPNIIVTFLHSWLGTFDFSKKKWNAN